MSVYFLEKELWKAFQIVISWNFYSARWVLNNPTLLQISLSGNFNEDDLISIQLVYQ